MFPKFFEVKISKELRCHHLDYILGCPKKLGFMVRINGLFHQGETQQGSMSQEMKQQGETQQMSQMRKRAPGSLLFFWR